MGSQGVGYNWATKHRTGQHSTARQRTRKGCKNIRLKLAVLIFTVVVVQLLSRAWLQLHGQQHARPPCPSPSPGACSNSCPLSQWCHPTISSSVVPFSSCLQSFPVAGYFPMSRLFASSGKNIRALASVLPMNIQDWSPLGLTGFISAVQGTLKSLLQHHQKHQFFGAQPSLRSNFHIHKWLLEKPSIALIIQTFVGKVMSLLRWSILKWLSLCSRTEQMSKCDESHGSRYFAVGEMNYKYGNREDKNVPLGCNNMSSWVIKIDISSVPFSSVAQSYLTLCDPMDCSMPGLPVHHQLLEFTQTHVHQVDYAIQPSHPLSSPSLRAFYLSQH